MKKQVNMVRRYRVKPNYIEAINLECEQDFDTAALWCGGKVRDPLLKSDGDYDISIQIPSLDSEPLIARRGMTIIKAADGGFGIIDTKVFLETYEKDIPRPRNGLRPYLNDWPGPRPETYTSQVDEIMFNEEYHGRPDFGEDTREEGDSSLG